jgi:ribosome biogenesis GTPase
VLAAVESGELPERRLESYRKLLKEARWMAMRHDARLRQQELAKWKHLTKAMRASSRIRP